MEDLLNTDLAVSACRHTQKRLWQAHGNCSNFEVDPPTDPLLCDQLQNTGREVKSRGHTNAPKKINRVFIYIYFEKQQRIK